MVWVLERWRREERESEREGKEERACSQFSINTQQTLRKGEWLPSPLTHFDTTAAVELAASSLFLLTHHYYILLRWVFVSSSSPSDPNTTHILSLFSTKHTFTHFASSLFSIDNHDQEKGRSLSFSLYFGRKSLSSLQSRLTLCLSLLPHLHFFTFSLFLSPTFPLRGFSFLSCPHFIIIAAKSMVSSPLFLLLLMFPPSLRPFLCP